MKKMIKSILPASLLQLFTKQYTNTWQGDYSNWQVAVKKCSGYDTDIILEKVKEAVMKVKAGEAMYEQDAVLFYQANYSWPLLSGLFLAAATYKRNLTVLDFGGSLGSSYYQHKTFLDELKSVQWNVVEQPSFVEYGKGNLQCDRLQFFYTPEECIENNGLPLVLVISTTLPYLENPGNVLKALLTLHIPYIIIDNTIFNYEARDRITIQIVPKTIYKASYPCWFLDYKKVLNEVKQHYTIISEHKNEHVIYLDGIPIPFRGFFGKLKTTS